MTALLIATVYFLVIGVGVKGVLSRRPETLFEWLGTSLLYGIGAAGLLGQIAGALSIPLGRPFFFLLFAGGATLVIVRKPWPLLLPFRASVLTSAAALLTLVPIGVLLLNCVTTPVTDYDGRVTWVLKARAVAREHAITGRFFQGLSSRDAHSQYPLLMPIAGAALLEVGQTDDDHAVKPAYALTALAFLLTLYAAMARVAPPETAAVLTACVAWLPQFAAQSDGGMLSAYSDVPLIAFTTLAILSLLGNGLESPIALGVELSFVACVKSEGIILVFALFVFAVGAAGKQWRRRLPITAGIVAVTLSVLAFWRLRVPLEHDENYTRLIGGIGRHLVAVPFAARELLSRMLDMPAWGLFWPMAALAFCIAMTDRRQRRVSMLAAAAICLIFAAYIAAYAVTNWSIAELASSSANRLLLHGVPFAALLLAAGAQQLDARDPSRMRRP